MKFLPIFSFRPLSILSLFAATLFPSCSSVSESIGSGITNVTKRPRSFEKTKESVTVSTHKEASGDAVSFGPIKSDGSGEGGQGAYGAGFLPSGLADRAAGYVVDQLEKGVTSAAGNYSVVYSGTYIGDNLNGAHGFDLKRSVNKGAHEAMHMRLDFTKSGDNAYTLGLNRIKLSRAKSAVPFWDDDVDMVVKVELSVLDPKKSAMISVVNAEFVAKGVELEQTKEFHDQQTGYRTNWFRFPGYDTKTVPYKVTITVQETSSFYKVAEKGKSLVSDKKKGWTESLAGALSKDD